jgi:hypothetical protein
MLNKFNSFEDLPIGLRERILSIASDNLDEWLRKPIPALEGKSFLQTLNEENGYDKICKFLIKVEAYLR